MSPSNAAYRRVPIDKFRLPETSLKTFKSLCYQTAEHISVGSSKPLRGNRLLNPFSIALGWSDFNELQKDSKTYGSGSIQWDRLYEQLRSHCPKLLKVPSTQFNRALYLASQQQAAQYSTPSFQSAAFQNRC